MSLAVLLSEIPEKLCNPPYKKTMETLLYEKKKKRQKWTGRTLNLAVCAVFYVRISV